jgi:hypothetical protein
MAPCGSASPRPSVCTAMSCFHSHVARTGPPGDAELVKPRLPGAPSWQRALDLAGKLFGISVGGKALNARNLRTLFDRLHEEWKKARNNRADEVADLLLRRTDFFTGDPPRLVTARKVTELFGHLAHSDAVDMVESLAGLQPATSRKPWRARFVTPAKRCGC